MNYRVLNEVEILTAIERGMRYGRIVNGKPTGRVGSVPSMPIRELRDGKIGTLKVVKPHDLNTTKYLYLEIRPSTETGLYWLSAFDPWGGGPDCDEHVCFPFAIRQEFFTVAFEAIGFPVYGTEQYMGSEEAHASHPRIPVIKPYVSAVDAREERRKKISYTYFIQSGEGGNIKIGRAFDPQKRLHDLQCGSGKKLILLATIEGGAKEHELHVKFKQHRTHGEWFAPHPDLLAFIANVKSSQENAA